MRQTPQSVSPMSNEGRNAYVLRHITDAFLDLLAVKPLDSISISELCENAGVGRASFYRNFENKEAILKAYIDQIFREWTGRCSKEPLSEQIRAMFSHFEKHRSFYKLLYERRLLYLLKDAIVGICGPRPEYTKEAAYAAAFVAYSLYGWTEVWFQRGMQETAEEMAALFRAQGL